MPVVHFKCSKCGEVTVLERTSLELVEKPQVGCSCHTCGQIMRAEVGILKVPDDLAEDESEVRAFES